MKLLPLTLIITGVGLLLYGWTRRRPTSPMSLDLTTERLQMLCKLEEPL